MESYTDNEILEATKRLYSMIAESNPATRKKDCKYLNIYKDKGHYDGKYCLATTHKKCTKTCPFFEPTMMAKFRVLLMQNIEYRQRMQEQAMEITSLNAKVQFLRQELQEKD